jgi:hypothetical protein
MMSRTSVFSITRGFYTVGREQGKESVASDPPGKAVDGAVGDESGGSLNTIPELMRRIVAVGLSGFFFTEEAIRKALGDTLPKDWIDFAADQSERTRGEFLERLSLEIGRTLENVDVADVLSRLLAGNTIEVNAEIRLKPTGEGGGAKLTITAKNG